MPAFCGPRYGVRADAASCIPEIPRATPESLAALRHLASRRTRCSGRKRCRHVRRPFCTRPEPPHDPHTPRAARVQRLFVIATLVVALLATAAHAQPSCSDAGSGARQRVGVALGGGSARGLAHVGVLRWLEEHHIPVDVLAGTSMGGLIGGSYATGMSPDEIEAMLAEIDWDAMFGSSSFQFSNVRRKRDKRDYPSHLEFGLQERAGAALVAEQRPAGRPAALADRGRRITASSTFDELPTPFRCVAVDLKTRALRRARSRSARHRDARDDVAAARLPADRGRRSAAGRRRRDEQRARRRRAADGRRSRDCRERRRPDRSRDRQRDRCWGSPAPRSTR